MAEWVTVDRSYAFDEIECETIAFERAESADELTGRIELGRISDEIYGKDRIKLVRVIDGSLVTETLGLSHIVATYRKRHTGVYMLDFGDEVMTFEVVE